MKEKIKTLLAPLKQNTPTVHSNVKTGIEIRLSNNSHLNRVIQILSDAQLLDKVQIDTPLFSFRLKQAQPLGQTTIRTMGVICRKNKADKKSGYSNHARKHLTKLEEKALMQLLLS